MLIQTKYNKGDEVYFMRDNCINKEKILAIEATLSKDATSIVVYYFIPDEEGALNQKMGEGQLFETIDKLIARLRTTYNHYYNNNSSTEVGQRLSVGQRFQLNNDVDRFPDFIGHKGQQGYVHSIEGEVVFLKMDTHIDGAEEWDNCIQWHDMKDFLSDTSLI